MDAKKKKTYTGMKAVKIEFDHNDVIATSGACTIPPVDFPGTMQCGFRPSLRSID